MSHTTEVHNNNFISLGQEDKLSIFTKEKHIRFITEPDTCSLRPRGDIWTITL